VGWKPQKKWFYFFCGFYVVFKKPVKNQSFLKPQKKWFYIFCGFYVVFKKPVKNRSGLGTTKKVVFLKNHFFCGLGLGVLNLHLDKRLILNSECVVIQGPVSEFHKAFRLYENQDENAWRRPPAPVIATRVRL